MSTLYHTAFLGSHNVCKWLIDQRVNVYSFNRIDGTPLLCTVANYHRALPEKLNVLKTLLLHRVHADGDIDFTREILGGVELPYGSPVKMGLLCPWLTANQRQGCSLTSLKMAREKLSMKIFLAGYWKGI